MGINLYETMTLDHKVKETHPQPTPKVKRHREHVRKAVQDWKIR